MKEKKEGKKELNWEQVRDGMRREERGDRLSDAYFIPCTNVAGAEFDTRIERFLYSPSLSLSLSLSLPLSPSNSTLSDCC